MNKVIFLSLFLIAFSCNEKPDSEVNIRGTFIYFEDADWSIRMTNLGYKLGVVPKSIIYHLSSGSNKKNNTSNEGNISPYAHYLNVRNHIYLIKKYTFFNSIGSWGYQILKITSYSIYFILFII